MVFALLLVLAFLAFLVLLAVRARALRARRAAMAAAANDIAATGAALRIPGDLDVEQTAAWIWKQLVPRSGQASTVQGELLRALEKLRWEACNNGNINWDDGFERLIAYLHTQLVERSTLPGEMKMSVLADLVRLNNFLPVEQLEDDRQAGFLPCVDDYLYDRLTEAVVAFARLNTVPIPREPDPALHR